MSREIPFFELFAQLQLSPELRLKLLGAVIASACIHQDTLSMELAMIVKHPLEPSDLDELNSAIRNGYGLNEVRFRVTLKEEQLPSQRKAAAAPSAPSGGGPSGPVLMGNPIKVKPVEMKTLDLKMGNATVSGKVFSVECVETRRPGMWRLHVEMTDYTSSVAVHKNLTEKEAKGLDGKINPGMWLCVQGKMEPTWDGKDIQLNPYHINVIQHEERQDTAPVKRVELHLHTKMSNMDALTDTKEVIKEAIRWGHPAIAITDHGVAQSFPDAWHAAGDKIKILYGVEGYFINNVDDRIAVHGRGDCGLDDEFVCFDIETTGLKVDREAITEIGAVVLKNGEIAERFQTFVNPNRRLTPEIIGLTGDYTSIEECSEKTKISQAALKIRCNKSGKMADGTLYEWIDSHTKKSYQAKKSRNKGSAWEADIIHHLRDMGYTECVSARGESKFTDNNKVDLIDRSGKLPVNIQAKHTANTPAYFKIEDACPYKDKPFVLCWKKAPTEGSVSPGARALT